LRRLKVKESWPAIAGVLVILAAWTVVSALPYRFSFFVPGPVAVARALVARLGSSAVLRALAATVARTAAAFFVSAVVGAALGLVIGTFARVRKACWFPLHFIRSVPVTAFIPLFIVLSGGGAMGALALATFGSLLIVVAYTAIGVGAVSQTRILYARSAGASRADVLRRVVFYEALPSVMAGLRVSVSLSLILVIVGELVIGAPHGLGRLINDFRYRADYPSMYAAILITGVLGYLLNELTSLAARRIVHWPAAA
jgi:NitT/TauT family transport system permease protein